LPAANQSFAAEVKPWRRCYSAIFASSILLFPLRWVPGSVRVEGLGWRQKHLPVLWLLVSRLNIILFSGGIIFFCFLLHQPLMFIERCG